MKLDSDGSTCIELYFNSPNDPPKQTTEVLVSINNYLYEAEVVQGRFFVDSHDVTREVEAWTARRVD